MKRSIKVLSLMALVLSLALLACPLMANEHAEGMSADEALEKLRAGNDRFLSAAINPGDVSHSRREELFGGQAPYAVVLACSDSRVVPEAIFSAGLGELFVIRVAGNVIGSHELGSIEYATGHLGTNLVVVLGHESCGAVGAAMSGHAEGHINSLAAPIKRAIGDEKDPKAASKANANYVVDEIMRTVKFGGNVKVVSAFYNLNGKVDFGK